MSNSNNQFNLPLNVMTLHVHNGILSGNPNNVLPPLGSQPTAQSSATPSHYTFDGQVINGHSRILASEVRTQVNNAPSYPYNQHYPSPYNNYEGLNFNFPPGHTNPRGNQYYLHTSVTPNQTTHWQPGTNPGPFRAVYNQDPATGRPNTGNLGFMFHDSRNNGLFTMGHYHR